MDGIDYQGIEDAILSDRTIRRGAAAQAEQLLTGLELQQDNLVPNQDDDDNNILAYDGVPAQEMDSVLSAPESDDNASMSDMGNEADESIHASDNDTESHSSSDSDNGDDVEFRQRLRVWVLDSGTPLLHTTSLLALLRPHFPLLPKDGRTLLHTIRTYTIEDIAGGKYHHFGISKGIKMKLEKYDYFNEYNELSLQINIDGLPLFKSTSDCFWPILALIRQEQPEPFVIGLWVGTSKPTDANVYLQHLIDEMKDVMIEGVCFNEKIYRISIENFVCDTPARSFIKITKGHSGYHGCDYCEQRGVYYMHRMTFPERDATVRTDSF